MADIVRIQRELAPQRTISLFKDQEERINELSKKMKISLKFSNFVREGVDSLLDSLEKKSYE